MKVYLAGGSKAGWQDRVIAEVPGVKWHDPRGHGLSEKESYVKWDIGAIETCDLLFACLDAGNPYGYNMALEIGWALARRIPVILVDEKHADNHRALSMVRVLCDSHDTLAGGIEALKERLAA